MRKISLSNDSKRDAEVAYGTSFHRPSPVYKTADGKRGQSERRVKATMGTTDEALLAQYGEGLADALKEYKKSLASSVAERDARLKQKIADMDK